MTDEVALEPVPGVRIVWDPEIQPGQAPGWKLEAVPGGEASTLRVLTASGEEGGLLLIAGLRAEGADGHDSEQLAATLGGPDGSLHAAEEVLISTEHTADGRVRRLGLEIYMPGEDYPLRGAGVASADADQPIQSTLFDFRFDGQPGTARLDLMSLPA